MWKRRASLSEACREWDGVIPRAGALRNTRGKTFGFTLMEGTGGQQRRRTCLTGEGKLFCGDMKMFMDELNQTLKKLL